MSPDRRLLVSTGIALGLLAPAAASAAAPRKAEAGPARSAAGPDLGLVPDAAGDQSAAMQRAIDRTSERGVALALPAGKYLVRGLQLRAGTQLSGTPGRTILALAGDGRLVTGDGANGARLAGLVLAGASQLTGNGHLGLVNLARSRDIRLDDLEVVGSPANGIVLDTVSGAVRDCRISNAGLAGLLSIDAQGLEIAHNQVRDCANNGILVWRSKAGEDGTIVAHNRIERIKADAGGSGQNGNGINVYRAGSVLVTGNRIADCAYSAIRGNAASNIQMVANSCQRLGEVALYAEFGFEGALIASNVVEAAATGISVTNFNEGGRLAVIQGNIVRNLRRREHEPVDKRGDGIAVEADATVTGNTIEGAAGAGIVVGWGPYMRDVAVTSNVIRRAGVGIMITRDATGAALIAQNLISSARQGAIRAMDQGRPVGPDLARAGSVPPGRVTIAGNVVADAGA